MKALSRWDPLRDFEQLSNLLDRLLVARELTGPESGREALTVADWTPMVDIEETTEDYIIKVELPEVKKEDVKVAVEEGVLSIQGERKQGKEVKDKKVHRVERFYGNFMRSFTLPDNVEPDGVRAEFKDGMLCVKLHKSQEAKPEAIDITVD